MTTFPLSAHSLIQQAMALLLYQSVLEEDVGQAFLQLLNAIVQAQDSLESGECLRAYGRWFHLLADRNQSWQDYLLTRVLRDSNPFSRQAQRSPLAALPPALTAAARHDLTILQQLYHCQSQQVCEWIQAIDAAAAPVPWETPSSIPAALQSRLPSLTSWAEALEVFAAHYQAQGVGLFGQYQAFRWQMGRLQGIPHPDSVRISHLVGYESQKALLLKNTEFLLNGYPALHVLLYGSRGSGKSSLVKGLLWEYGDRGLRLIEVAKSELRDLPTIVEVLRDAPQKFILFVDDLSFEEEEDSFKALKVVLEGNLTARPQNVVVYATSNRRHLIREFFGDRPRPSDGDEVHAWDTVQEKLSFSDRFGLTLTFEPANQKTYLEIVHHLAAEADLRIDAESLEFQALQWATRHNGRSGRTAQQFIDFLRSDALTSPP